MRIFTKVYEYLRNHEKLIIILLILVSCLVHHRLLSFRMMNFSDFHYYTDATMRDIGQFSVWKSNGELGTPDPLVWRVLHDPFIGIANRLLNASYIPTITLVLLLPTFILTPLAGYLFFKQLTKSKFGATIGALLFTFNSYFLAITTQGHILLQTAAVMGTFSVYFLLKYLEKPIARYQLMASVIFLVFSSYLDIRMFYIYVPLIAAVAIYEFLNRSITLKQLFKIGLFYTALTGLLSLFWVLSFSPSDSDVLARGLFGNDFWQLKYAITLSHPFWRLGEVVWFSEGNSVPLSSWLFPLISILTLIWLGTKHNKKVVFWSVIGIVGIFLSKQVDKPFGGIYIWLYENVIGFNAFREATKFYILIVLSYGFLLGEFATKIRLQLIQPLYRNTLIVITLLAILVPAYPIITNKVGNLYRDSRYPTAYKQFNDFIESQGEYSRILWVPSVSSWASSTNTHPTVSPFSLIKTVGTDAQKTATNQIKDLINNPLFKQSVSNANIKYIVVPVRDPFNGDTFKYYGDQREEFISLLDRLDWLTKSAENYNGLVVYVNNNFQDYIKFTDTPLAYNGKDSTAMLRYLALNTQQDWLYTGEDGGLDSKLAHISPISEIVMNQLSQNEINLTQVSSTQKSSIEFIKPPSQIGYTLNNGNLTLTATNTKLLSSINGQPALNTSDIVTLLNTNYTGQVYARLDDKSYTLTPSTTPRYVDYASKDVEVFQVNKLKTNIDFEDGDTTKLETCKDQKPMRFDIENNPDKDTGRSIAMRTIKNKVCLKLDVPIKDNDTHLVINLDHYYAATDMVGLTVEFNDPSELRIPITFSGGSLAWRHLTKIINLPSNTSTATIKFYAYPSENTNKITTTWLDNIDIKSVTSIKKVALTEINLSDKLPFTNSFTNTVPITKKNNLVKNPAFDDGPWQNKVADCNAYDSNPDISMDIESDAVYKNSLVLKSKRHIACTEQLISNIEEGSSYRLRMSYKTIKTKYAGINIKFNDKNNTVISLTPTANKQNSWEELDYTFETPYGATSLNLTLYSYPESEGGATAITKYDNLSINKTPNINGSLYMVTDVSKKTNTNAKVTYIAISSTKKIANLSALKDAAWLKMGEAYHKKWIARVDSNRISQDHHFKLNGWQNAWYIDPTQLCKDNPPGCTRNSDGSYNLALTIEFTPQRWFNIGLVISGTTLLACLSYLGYDFVKTRRNRGQLLPPKPGSSTHRFTKTQKHPLLHRRKNRVYSIKR